VCDRTVTKALPSFHAVAPDPDRELADARAAIDRGDEPQALKRLERARRGYAKRHDAPGLEHLLVLADVLEGSDERVRIGRANLDYAIKQNLRFESRRRAHFNKESWQDPYPGLAAPTEHTGIRLGRGVKLAIGAGIAVVIAVVAAILLVAVFTSPVTEKATTLRLVNDLHLKATVRGCDDQSCDTSWMHADLDPGLSTERDVPVSDVIDYFQIKLAAGETRCLPLRIHDAYLRAGADPSLVLVARLSRATPCPGRTVLPTAGVESGL
jgi:hypothetical protein